jgi:hypothetical protein
MIRNILLGALTLAFAAAGCAKDDPRQRDMPVKGQQGVDRKGRPMKTMEATFEDPNPRPKKAR